VKNITVSVPDHVYRLSYWDSAIIEASRAMGCTEVLSEDLGDGQDYAGVRIINPFRSTESAEPVLLTLARRAQLS
jgi:predicted nucleic acid-binding protein